MLRIKRASAFRPGPGSGKIASMRDKAANQPIRVAIVVFDGVALFELGAARDVFGTEAATVAGRPLYEVSFCGPAATVVTEAGFAMEVPAGLDTLRDADTIVVPPTMLPGHAVPAAVLGALCQARSDGKRLLSLCTGAFVLAAAGLLDGRTATTHWSESREFAPAVPGRPGRPDCALRRRGRPAHVPGSAASLDLCLHVVQRDYGTDVAAKVARDLVIPLHRTGGQAQYIEAPMPRLTEADLFDETLTWLLEHLDEPVTVAGLAVMAAMAPRTFARRFLGGHRDDAAAVDPQGTAAARAAAAGDDRPPGRRGRPQKAASAAPTTCASTSRARSAPRPRPTAAAFQDLPPDMPRHWQRRSEPSRRTWLTGHCRQRGPGSWVSATRPDRASCVPALKQRPGDGVHDGGEQARHAEAGPRLEGAGPRRGRWRSGPGLARPVPGDRVP